MALPARNGPDRERALLVIYATYCSRFGAAQALCYQSGKHAPENPTTLSSAVDATNTARRLTTITLRNRTIIATQPDSRHLSPHGTPAQERETSHRHHASLVGLVPATRRTLARRGRLPARNQCAYQRHVRLSVSQTRADGLRAPIAPTEQGEILSLATPGRRSSP